MYEKDRGHMIQRHIGTTTYAWLRREKEQKEEDLGYEWRQECGAYLIWFDRNFYMLPINKTSVKSAVPVK